MPMTAYVPSTDEPSGNDTQEKSLAHKMLTLHNLYKGITYQEAAGTQLDSGLAPLIDVSIIRAADKTYRLVGRVCLELDPAYEVDPGKLWSFVQSFGEAQVPTAYKED
jgi:hypothetical protein